MNYIKKYPIIQIVTLLICCLFATDAKPVTIEKTDIDKALSDIKDYEYQMGRKPLLAIENIVQQSHGQAELRKYIEQQLLKLLQSDATIAAKQFICRQLWVIGSVESVPTLRKMLTNEKTVEIACFALRENPSPDAGRALREAMEKVEGQVLISILNLVGARRDAQCVEAVSKHVFSEDAAVAAAAVAAMGKIGGNQATKVLAKARKEVSPNMRLVATNAYLQCAEGFLAQGKKEQASAMYRELNSSNEATLVRAAAIRGLVDVTDVGARKISLVLSALRDKEPIVRRTAIKCIRTMQEKGVTERLAKELPKMPPDVQVPLIGTFADRGDIAARPAIAAATKSTNVKVRTAAVQALGKIGDASFVGLLVQAAAKDISPEEKNAALNSLRLLSGDGVDAAIIKSMNNSQPSIRSELIQILLDRNVVSAVPDLLKEAAAPDENVSKTAFKALGRLAGEKDLPSLIKLLVNLQGDSARKGAERAAVMVSRKIGDKREQADVVLDALQSENRIPAKCSLLRVLGGIANEKAFESLRAALEEDSAQVQDEAVRALANWPDETTIDVLLDIFKNTSNETHRVLALRGYVRLLPLVTGCPVQEILKMYREAMSHAHRPEEKKLILAGLANISKLEALKMVQSYLDDESTRDEASLAAVAISEKIVQQKPGEVADAMQKVMQVTDNKDVTRRAKVILDEAKKAAGR